MAGGGDVPEHTGRIPQVGDAQSPAFLLGRAWGADPKAFVELERFDVLPPAVQVGDDQLHHVVLGPLLHIEVLQQEGRGIPPLPQQDPSDLLAQWRDSEAEGLVEALAALEVLRRNEGRSEEHTSEERRVGKEWVRTCRSRWAPYT